MTRFVLVFRRNGERDRIEHRFNGPDAEPRIGGRALLDGRSEIRGAEWLVRREDAGRAPRFACKLVAEPVEP